MTFNKLEKKDLNNLFLRTIPMEASFNYERMMSLAFSYSMYNIIEKLYPNKEDQIEAAKRHLEFFNCTSATSPIVAGTIAALEEKKASDPTFDTNTINSVKISLMGPLSGVGDSIFWGSLKVIATGIGIALTVKGNILGPILFLLLYNIPNLLVRYFGTFWGYKLGTSLSENIDHSVVSNITFIMNVLGTVVIGGMVATMISINISVGIGGFEGETIQSFIDSFMPAFLPLVATFLIRYLLKKKVKVSYILLSILVISVLGAMFGFLA
ncbi:MAG: PTS system mannose/fructose/sorbose family transporter subunit IID [Erysipelotrichaceae bacterium]|nr:PTS system mannose/fructose/sorbose family transporter subunit IID [Erysipelotrichaceae bacterium]